MPIIIPLIAADGATSTITISDPIINTGVQSIFIGTNLINMSNNISMVGTGRGLLSGKGKPSPVKPKVYQMNLAFHMNISEQFSQVTQQQSTSQGSYIYWLGY